jgi:hypothetical protein
VQDVVHEAALASGKLTRDKTGGQLTFPEVIMSRLRSILMAEWLKDGA